MWYTIALLVCSLVLSARLEAHVHWQTIPVVVEFRRGHFGRWGLTIHDTVGRNIGGDGGIGQFRLAKRCQLRTKYTMLCILTA